MAGSESEAHPTRARRWPRRALIGLNVAVALCVLGAGLAYAYVRYRFNQIPRAACVQCVPTEGGGTPMTVLLVGSDSREGLSAAERQSFCQQKDCRDQTGPEHSDTIMLLRTDPARGKASLLSIPRDLNVAIPGTTHRDRINSTYAGGPGRLAQAIRDNLGITVNHYIGVNFVGFRGIVSAIAGIDVYFPSPARDKLSGLHVANPGCVHLDPDNALGYVRSRHYEYFEGGRWHDDPYSDFSRIQRQQDFLRRVMRKALAVRNPITVNSLIDTAVHDVKIDDKLTRGDLLGLGRRFHSLSPDAVDMMTLPTDPITVGGAAELRLHEPAASATIARFLQGPPPPAPPAPTGPAVLRNTIQLRVLNGSGKPGEGSSVARQLTEAGYSVASTGDADSFHYIASVIRYGTRQLAEAQQLRSSLLGDVTLRPDSTLRDVDLTLVIGSTFSGVRRGPEAPPSSVTTDSGAQATPGGPPKNRGASAQPQC
jgi:LCP family protein required for cell wall assembly